MDSTIVMFVFCQYHHRSVGATEGSNVDCFQLITFSRLDPFEEVTPGQWIPLSGRETELFPKKRIFVKTKIPSLTTSTAPELPACIRPFLVDLGVFNIVEESFNFLKNLSPNTSF